MQQPRLVLQAGINFSNIECCNVASALADLKSSSSCWLCMCRECEFFSRKREAEKQQTGPTGSELKSQSWARLKLDSLASFGRHINANSIQSSNWMHSCSGSVGSTRVEFSPSPVNLCERKQRLKWAQSSSFAGSNSSKLRHEPWALSCSGNLIELATPQLGKSREKRSKEKFYSALEFGWPRRSH